MKIKKFIKANKLIALVTISYLVVLAYDPGSFIEAVSLTGGYLREMLEIMPAVFVLSALISVWIPREVIIRNFGNDSGIRGKAASLLIGSVSAGPIYAAFPITQSLFKKGASISNIVIIISAWAVVKIPMLLVEARFLGPRFATVRYILTVPSIFLIAYICQKVLSRKDLEQTTSNNVIQETLTDEVRQSLPGHDCGVCGFNSCSECASAIANSDTESDICIPGGREVENKIISLINSSS